MTLYLKVLDQGTATGITRFDANIRVAIIRQVGNRMWAAAVRWEGFDR